MKKYVINIFSVIIIIFITFLVSYYTFINQLAFLRLIYPLQANLAIWKIKCSNNSPLWMRQSLKYIILNQKNLSNQLAYIDGQQKLHHCESGWFGRVIFSESLQYKHRFRYASLTKILTSHAVLDLMQQRNLSLDTHFVELFEELRSLDYKDPRIKNITLGQLLEHRSGFDRMRSEDVVFAINKKSWCPYDIIKIHKLRLDFEPNKKYAYDNRNYCLLGAVIERLSGQSYRNYMQQHYPLSQYNIRFVDGAYFADEVQYDFRNNNFWMPLHDNQFDFKALSSSAGLSGNASALANILNILIRDQNVDLLAISPVAKASCQLHQFDSCNGYAMWQYQPSLADAPMYFRRGGLPAVTSLAMITKDKEVVVWMGNGASKYDEYNSQYHLERYFYQLLNQR